jgi:hypothetical protein
VLDIARRGQYDLDMVSVYLHKDSCVEGLVPRVVVLGGDGTFKK